MALQAATPPILPSDFDLARLRPIELYLRPAGGTRCSPGPDGVIIICGRRPGGAGYPLAEMARLFAVRPFGAETGTSGNGTARAFSEQGQLDRGAVSNRAMIGIRLPF